MQSLNQVNLIGYLGGDPELKSTSNGTAVLTFSLATTSSYKPKGSDEWVENTEWHRITLWADRAERFAERANKGDRVFVTGRLQTRDYEDKEGIKKYVTEIVANDTIIVSKASDRAQNAAVGMVGDAFSSKAENTVGMVKDAFSGKAEDKSLPF
jgi:single-strand DNA-binding protein